LWHCTENAVILFFFCRPEEPWSLYFQFPSKDAAKKYALVKMYERDISYGSLLNVMVRNGYGSDDSICYLRKDGIGLQGISVITNNTEVDDMINQFKTSQTLCLYVKEGKLNIKQSRVNKNAEHEEVDPAETIVDLTVDPPVVFAVNESGVVHKTTDDYVGSSYFVGTQESVNYMPIKAVPPPCQLLLGTQNDPIEPEMADAEQENNALQQVNTQVSVNYADFQFDTDEEEHAANEDTSDEDDDSVFDEDFIAHVDLPDAEEEESESMEYEEEDSVARGEKQRRTVDSDLKETISDIKRKRAQYMSSTHCEGDTDPEDLYDIDLEEEGDDCQEIAVPDPVEKKVKRPGPTSRSHSSAARSMNEDWYPSSEEDDTGFEADDDGNEPMSFVIPSGRRSRAKKRPPRVWYDEERLHPEQQFQLRLCFRDVYQFREALVNLHVKQLRRYKYHRNCSDRIIVCCDGEGCQFHMVAAKISNEPTFCIKKMILEHTCPTQSEKTRISSKWLGNKMLETIRSDPNTTVPAIVDKAKRQFGVEVPKMMAWRAKRKAKEIVLGDHKRQYKRLRDYLETVKVTNPGSRCIVTTVSGKTRENPTAGPRFHGLFSI
jgi:hypothetical protein